MVPLYRYGQVNSYPWQYLYKKNTYIFVIYYNIVTFFKYNFIFFFTIIWHEGTYCFPKTFGLLDFITMIPLYNFDLDTILLPFS